MSWKQKLMVGTVLLATTVIAARRWGRDFVPVDKH